MASKKKTAAKGKDKTPVNVVPTLGSGEYKAGEAIGTDDALYVSPDDGKLYTTGELIDYLGTSTIDCVPGIVLRVADGDIDMGDADRRAELLASGAPVGDASEADYEIVDVAPAAERVLFLWWEQKDEGKNNTPRAKFDELPSAADDGGSFVDHGATAPMPDGAVEYSDETTFDAPIAVLLNDHGLAALAANGCSEALDAAHTFEQDSKPRMLHLWFVELDDDRAAFYARWDRAPFSVNDGGVFTPTDATDAAPEWGAAEWPETRSPLMTTDTRATLVAYGLGDAIRAADAWDTTQLAGATTIEQRAAGDAWQRAETIDSDGQIPLIPHDESLIRTTYPVHVVIANSSTATLVHRALDERAAAIAKLATTTKKEGYARLATQVANDAEILREDVMSQIEVEQELSLPRFGSLAHGCAASIMATLTEYVAGKDARERCANRVGDIMATFGRTVAEKAHARGLSERQYTSEGICLEALGGALVRDVNAE